MRLYLVQHGEAVSAEVDPTRPLSDRGIADIERLGAFLAGQEVAVVRVVHSGIRRAEQTAEGLGEALGAPTERYGQLQPHAILEPFLAELLTWKLDTMVVGHLPFVARLADRLATGREDSCVVAFRPGSVVCLERTDPDHWVIPWMVRPELI